MTRLKICGITNEKEINMVNQSKPDYIGFVFAESRRRITPETAWKLRNGLEPGIRTVGVFVDEPLDMILKLAGEGVIDLIQLHGNEDERTITALKEKTSCPVIKAVRVRNSDQIRRSEKLPCDFLLLDSFQSGTYGGSGVCFDHALIPDLQKPFFIAGGLNAGNIGQLIAQYRPYGVDVSSGAETDGIKDENKIRQLVELISDMNIRKEWGR